ncbi:hypothetical protein P8452_43752 [Trifolium repens]|nr:hypothetical protein P8452_43752 [Trifolium repens]
MPLITIPRTKLYLSGQVDERCNSDLRRHFDLRPESNIHNANSFLLSQLTVAETWNGKRKFIADQFAEVNRLGFGGLNCPIIASFLCMMFTMLMRSYEPRRNR